MSQYVAHLPDVAGDQQADALVLELVGQLGSPAPERDLGAGGADDLVGQRLGELHPDINPGLGHRLDHDGMDLLGRVRPSRADCELAVCELVREQRGGFDPRSARR
jgi:hypothetical protein